MKRSLNIGDLVRYSLDDIGDLQRGLGIVLKISEGTDILKDPLTKEQWKTFYLIHWFGYDDCPFMLYSKEWCVPKELKKSC